MFLFQSLFERVNIAVPPHSLIRTRCRFLCEFSRRQVEVREQGHVNIYVVRHCFPLAQVIPVFPSTQPEEMSLFTAEMCRVELFLAII